VPRKRVATEEHFKIDNRLRLPKIKHVDLTEAEKEVVNMRVIRMKKMGYDPIGCSKSIRLEKVRLRKKLTKIDPFASSPSSLHQSPKS
jgi:hypothetical protein